MKILAQITLLCYTSILIGQIAHPKASPYSQLTQEIGLTQITVEYSRPGVNGRKIFGELVPYNRIWRVGANASTKITVDSDVLIADKLLPKGCYALYAFPSQDEWQIVFHKNTSHWGDGRADYDPSEDEFRILVVPETLPYIQQNFLICFDAINHNGATMQLKWDTTLINIPVYVPTDAQMMKQIDEKLAIAPTAQTYYETARYLQEQQKDFTTALQYLNQAIALGGDTYYFYRVKSLVEAELGMFDTAIRSAQQSLELAKSEEKDEFVRMNQKNIRLWKQQLNNIKNEN